MTAPRVHWLAGVPIFGRMTVFRAFLAPLLLVLLALPVAAQQLSLDSISRYLNALQSAQGEFRQVNPDGSVSTGTLYIRRPGRMRFEYDAPDNTLVLASGGTVAVFDGASNLGRPEQYPLAQTPLNLILERNVNLSRRGMVRDVRSGGSGTVVTAQDPRHPEYGSIALKFTANPVRLAEWTVTDGGGNRTRVILGPLDTGRALSPHLFSIQSEMARRR